MSYFGLTGKRLTQYTLAKQQEEIEEITSKIVEILEEKKRDHEDYKLVVDSAITNSYMKLCLDEASTIKWKPASDDLFN